MLAAPRLGVIATMFLFFIILWRAALPGLQSSHLKS